MDETSELIPTEQLSSEELTEAIAELEQYRERLVNDTMETAQRAKMMKSTVMAQLAPQLAEIDSMLEALRDRQRNSDQQ